MKKKKKAGSVLIVLGILLVCAALALFLVNQWAAAWAKDASDQILPQLKEHIETSDARFESDEMTEMMIDGYAYIGYLTVPALGLDLPVMSEWDYTRLKIAPCRYAGSTKTGNLVLCAHNYDRHFGNIKTLSVGDEVDFTDMDGVTTSYTVASVEILEPTAVEDMTDSGYDLTLFTCTYGGASRVTVRCEENI